MELAIGESGIESVGPITIGQLFKNTLDRPQKHPALQYKEDGEWKAISYKEYYRHCVNAARSFLKVGVGIVYVWVFWREKFCIFVAICEYITHLQHIVDVLCNTNNCFEMMMTGVFSRNVGKVIFQTQVGNR